MRLQSSIGSGVALLVAAAALTAAPVNAQVSLTGAGATFPNPIYTKWFDAYNKKTGVPINYQSIGSGGGIRQFTEGTVDFGASDGPMNDDQMQAVGGKVLHVPTVLGAVVLTYNLPGIGDTRLKFDGPTIVDIFQGKITKWNDKAIADLNPGAKLPETLITIVHRSDGSGTSFNVTNYLSKVSPEWKEKVGEGTTVSWPTGVGGKGNEGVAAYVKQIKDSVGYVEYAYALQNKLTFVQMQNHAGLWVKPDKASFSAAASCAPSGFSAFWATALR